MPYIIFDNDQGGIRPPWFSLFVTAGAAILYLLLGPAPEHFVFDRFAVQQGEWWRLITGHLVHGDFSHACWDVLAFCLISVPLEILERKDPVLVTPVAVILIDAWLWIGLPELDRYAGLSGIIVALFPLLLYRLWQRTKHPIIAIIAALAASKLIIEAFTGQAIVTNTLWPSLPSVHVMGVIAAVLFIMTGNLTARCRSTIRKQKIPSSLRYNRPGARD